MHFAKEFTATNHKTPQLYCVILVVANGTQKIVGLRKFQPDLGISPTFLPSLGFYHSPPLMLKCCHIVCCSVIETFQAMDIQVGDMISSYQCHQGGGCWGRAGDEGGGVGEVRWRTVWYLFHVQTFMCSCPTQPLRGYSLINISLLRMWPWWMMKNHKPGKNFVALVACLVSELHSMECSIFIHPCLWSCHYPFCSYLWDPRSSQNIVKHSLPELNDHLACITKSKAKVFPCIRSNLYNLGLQNQSWPIINQSCLWLWKADPRLPPATPWKIATDRPISMSTVCRPCQGRRSHWALVPWIMRGKAHCFR